MFAIQNQSASNAHSTITPSPAITMNAWPTRLPMREMSRSRWSDLPTPSGSRMPARIPHRMLITIAATMLPTIVHSMIGTQSTSVSGPPAACCSTTIT